MTIKPTIKYNVPEVHFTSEVVDLWEIQRQVNNPTVKDLKANYEKVKAKCRITEPLTWRQINLARRKGVSLFSGRVYSKFYGSWDKFLESVGEIEK
jgi:hypothetical protein